MSAIEKFMTRLSYEADGCWIWQGAVNSTGYSYTTIGGDSLCGAHRRAYELMVGPIPADKEIHHVCHQKRCCNPSHMELVSHFENIQRHRGTTEQDRREAVELAHRIGTAAAARQLGFTYGTLRRWGAPLQTRMVWTRERIIDAIRDFSEQYGQPPGARDWNPAMARNTFRDDIAERFYEDGCWPGSNTVQNRFGSWNAAIEAAGFVVLPPGRKHVDGPPIGPRACVGCDQQFTPRNRGQRYCTRSCYYEHGVAFAHLGGVSTEEAA